MTHADAQSFSVSRYGFAASAFNEFPSHSRLGYPVILAGMPGRIGSGNQLALLCLIFRALIGPLQHRNSFRH
jgi:hypothetical protein